MWSDAQLRRKRELQEVRWETRVCGRVIADEGGSEKKTPKCQE